MAERQQIVELGLKYNLLTRHTSFIAVSHVIRNQGGSASDVSQPLPLPVGVSARAIGAPMGGAPEPELVVLLAAAALMLAGLWSRQRRLGARAS